MMNYIDEFKKNAISFSWSELKIGRFGYSDDNFYLQGRINDDYVMAYTLDYLSKNENEENSFLWELGSLSLSYDETEVYDLLDSITNSDEDLQAYYKWRWILVNNLLNEIKCMDTINALLEISEFWLDLQSPFDMPYQYQGINNDMTPEYFYTEEHLSKVILEHKEWLISEKKKLS
ncbi:DUF2247 family protein [Enterococcus faecalis]|uniref:DUF2247 family protein n=1 Tax=Enterococcus TaxID=1350 RepID=UPI000B2CE06A|nr:MULTISPECIES: DUF2247 family protein [Enterococcus]HEM8038989.1 DUF2247 family protein [Klebsiella aerogenes]EHK9412179.1 DUF2247 family protein [Enterococcus faecalis]ELT8950733.1 DUF2247 family protein [Enterococcus faecalis]MDN3198202.1 DUF2247 family protein [Enterococcus faecalis]HDT8186185.1 DUF2247 family protein [Enterococcus faecalis]